MLSLQSGDSVRLRVRGALLLDASMSELRQDTLILNLDGVDAPWPVSGFDLVTLERYADRTPRQGLRHGAVVGMVSGLFVGAGLALGLHALGSNDEPDAGIAVLRSALTGVGLGAVSGAVGGGILGGRQPGRGWVSLALPARR